MPGQGMQNIPLRIPETWDAAWYSQHIREVLALADTRNAIEGSGIVITGQSGEEATISTSDDLQNLLLQSFVLATPSGFLSFERVLSGESGVVDINDGGPNSSITIAIEEGGLALSKLRDLSDWGVLGNPFNTAGGVQNITANVDGEVFAVQGTELQFTLTPTWRGDHKWADGFAVLLGDDNDLTVTHDGANGSISNITGDLAIDSVGALDLAGLTFSVTTDGVEQLEIDEDGAWLLATDPGTVGQVPTSQGPGAPVVWTTPSGGSGAIGPGPDDIPTVPNAMDDEFDGTTLDAKWAWRNQGTSTTAFNAGSLRLIGQSNASAVNTRVIEQPVPVGTWRFRMRAAVFLQNGSAYGGICVTNNSNGRQVMLTAQNSLISQFRMTSVTAFSATTASNFNATLHGGLTQWRYYEVEYDGTNIITRHSQSGINGSFAQVATDPAASFLGTPTHIGIFNHPASTTDVSQTVVDWFRRMS